MLFVNRQYNTVPGKVQTLRYGVTSEVIFQAVNENRNFSGKLLNGKCSFLPGDQKFRK